MNDEEVRRTPGFVAGDRPRRRDASRVPVAAVQHPLDREARAALARVPGLDAAVKAVFAHGLERIWRMQNVGSALRVGDRQFAPLNRLWRGVVDRLGVDPAPPLYVRHGPLNAWTSGVDQPFVVVTTAMVSLTTPAELEFVLGHELGHIKCGHVLYNTIANQLQALVQLLPGVGVVLSGAAQVALLEWRRKAELSCDRFGLLACQDPDAALRLLAKLAGAPYAFHDAIDVEAFLAQYAELDRLDADALGFLYRMAAETTLTHPWTVERAWTLDAWRRDGGLEAVLAEAPWEPERPEAPSSAWPFAAARCAPCGALVPTGDRFCAACGAPAPAPPEACDRCGHPMEAGDRFCTGCGARAPARPREVT